MYSLWGFSWTFLGNYFYWYSWQKTLHYLISNAYNSWNITHLFWQFKTQMPRLSFMGLRSLNLIYYSLRIYHRNCSIITSVQLLHWNVYRFCLWNHCQRNFILSHQKLDHCPNILLLALLYHRAHRIHSLRLKPTTVNNLKKQRSQTGLRSIYANRCRKSKIKP